MNSDSPLDTSIQITQAAYAQSSSGINHFLVTRHFHEQLAAFCQLAKIHEPVSKAQLIRLIQLSIADIDQALNTLVNTILHHPKLQQLEASWRGLWFLVLSGQTSENVKIKMLNVTWKQLSRDFDRAIEFDQSQMFRKVYNNEFGMAGGEPYGVILGDYFIRHRPSKSHPMNDLETLREVSQVAAAAFAPFIASAHPNLFGLEDFSRLGSALNYETIFAQQEYSEWNHFRQAEDTRFIGLVLPKVLMRLPYETHVFRQDGFCFEEDVSARHNQHYLWGNACYAFGATLIQSFSNKGWFTNISGCPTNTQPGGRVAELPAPWFHTDQAQLISKYTTDILITDFVEKTLSDIGFISLCHKRDTDYAVFYSNCSIHSPPQYDDELATMNAKISAMLQYILCVSRFAHYIKIIGREKLGAFHSATECEDYLYHWLLSYSTGSSSGTEEQLAKYPLAEAKVDVKETPGKPGVYSCIIHLKPHMQYDQIVSSLKLVTQLSEVKI